MLKSSYKNAEIGQLALKTGRSLERYRLKYYKRIAGGKANQADVG